MKKLKFIFLFTALLFFCVYSYIWLVTAENIKAGITKEVEEAKNLGIIVEIENYNYSSFPFAVAVTARNPKLILKNATIGKSFTVKMPDIYISCNFLIKDCSSVINPEDRIEIIDEEKNEPLYEIKFSSGFEAKIQFGKSILIAESIEKEFDFDSLIRTLGFTAEKIVVLDLKTNQEVSIVKNLLLDETYDLNAQTPLVSTIKFGFAIDNAPSTDFYLSKAFNTFSINTNIENFRNLTKKSVESKEVKINSLDIDLDQTKLNSTGQFAFSNNNTPLTLNLNISINNYDHLIQRALLFMYHNDDAKKNAQYIVLKNITEKITGKPYGEGKASFNVETNATDPSNYIIGKSTLKEIMQLSLNQYGKKNNE